MMSPSTKHPRATRSGLRWWRLASLRWHVGGVVASLVVVTAIVHAYRFGTVQHTMHVFPSVSCEEALEVLRHAESWRDVHDQNLVSYRQTVQRIESIAQWLPERADFDGLNHQLRELADAHQCKLLALENTETSVGSRVGVMICKAHLRGDFAMIVRVLNQLPKLASPVSCDGIFIQHGAETDSMSTWCDATVSLRIPYSAPGTLAARLVAASATDTSNLGK